MKQHNNIVVCYNIECKSKNILSLLPFYAYEEGKYTYILLTDTAASLDWQ